VYYCQQKLESGNEAIALTPKKKKLYSRNNLTKGHSQLELHTFKD